MGPSTFDQFSCCDVHQVSTILCVIPWQVHTEGGEKGSCSSIYLKASLFSMTAALFSMTQKEPVCVLSITFLLSVKYLHFREQNSTLYLFPLQLSCKNVFPQLLLASLFGFS